MIRRRAGALRASVRSRHISLNGAYLNDGATIDVKSEKCIDSEASSFLNDSFSLDDTRDEDARASRVAVI